MRGAAIILTLLATGLATGLPIGLAAGPAAAQFSTHQVRPSAADPGVKAFDDPSLAVLPRRAAAAAPLVVFVTGTGGKPANTATIFRVIAGQGYRVLGLAYDETPRWCRSARGARTPPAPPSSARCG